MKKITTLYFILLFIPFSIHGQKLFPSDSFYVVEGNSNYKGPKDLSAKTKIYSTGDRIIIESEIIDDKLILNHDSFLSDRIDLWIALPPDNKDSLVASDVDFTLNPPCYYYRFDTTDKTKSFYQFYSISKGQAVPFDTSLKACNFFGQVHYGLYPDNRKAHRFDKENYVLMEKAIGEKLGHVEQGVQYKAETTKTGYKITATLSPLALAFVSVPEMNRLRVMIDIVDVDEENKYSILSSSSIRKVGQPKTYNIINFNKPFSTNVTTIPTYLFDSLNFYPTVMFNEKGFWSGVSIDRCCFSKDNCNIIESVFLRTTFGYKKRKVGKLELEELIRNEQLLYVPNGGESMLIGGTKEDYFINKKKFESYRRSNWEEWNFKGLKKEFVFPDQSIGLLLFSHKGGYILDSCAKHVTKVMRVMKVNVKESKELITINQDDCKQITYLGNLRIDELVIENIYWAKEGVMLMIEARIPAKGVKKYKITFQSDKAIVSEIKK